VSATPPPPRWYRPAVIASLPPRWALVGVVLGVGCGSSAPAAAPVAEAPPGATVATSSAPPAEAASAPPAPDPAAAVAAPAVGPSAPHPVLGRIARVALHWYGPEREVSLVAEAEVAPFVAAIGPPYAASAAMPRTMPFAEASYLDAAGAPVASVVFLGASDLGLISVAGQGTRELTGAESRALRGLLAQHADAGR
jgi:hypothetical protein